MAIQITSRRKTRVFHERLRTLFTVITVVLLMHSIDPLGRWRRLECASITTKRVLVVDENGRERVSVSGEGGEVTSVRVYNSGDQGIPTFELMASKSVIGGIIRIKATDGHIVELDTNGDKLTGSVRDKEQNVVRRNDDLLTK